ncbi:glutathione S-transferase 1-like [Cloeon dipterum]|uniref:glutathione S-transferase 1-like n=1 Tax=Cloeon dipterum TaxID=197152 RepID=UPI00321FD3EA
MPLNLYVMEVSPPNRAVLLCIKALELDVNMKPINLVAQEQLKPEFVKINPQHTLPTLEDDGFVIWDSHAICGYLVNKFATDDSLYPKDPQKRAVVDQRLHFDSGVLFPRLVDITFPLFVLKCGEIPEEKRKRVFDAYEFLEKFLGDSDYLAGNLFTIADMCCIATVSSLEEALRVPADDYPKVKAWIQRCRDNLPGYNEANQAGLDIFKGAVDGVLTK